MPRRRDVLVLCYHAVSTRWACDLAVTPTTLAGQLRYLLDRDYEPVTLSSALEGESENDRVAVTFDDGFLSVVTEALPVLESLGVPGTAFVCTDFVGQETPMSWPGIAEWLDGVHDDELLPMSWDDARNLVAANWEIGSHTCTHPYLTSLSDALLDRELRVSRETCERELGRTCRALAYPHSDVDDRVVERAAAAGYEWACTLPRRMSRQGPLSWPRIGLYEKDGPHTLWLKASPHIRRLRVSALGPVAEDVHRRVRARRASASSSGVPTQRSPGATTARDEPGGSHGDRPRRP
jgi:peptidoglycan/xylan/chitin deacetylase (PgdA/CDA1 family)